MSSYPKMSRRYYIRTATGIFLLFVAIMFCIMYYLTPRNYCLENSQTGERMCTENKTKFEGWKQTYMIEYGAGNYENNLTPVRLGGVDV